MIWFYTCKHTNTLHFKVSISSSYYQVYRIIAVTVTGVGSCCPGPIFVMWLKLCFLHMCTFLIDSFMLLMFLNLTSQMPRSGFCIKMLLSCICEKWTLPWWPAVAVGRRASLLPSSAREQKQRCSQELYGPPASPGHCMWGTPSLQDFHVLHFVKYWHSLGFQNCTIDWRLSLTAGLWAKLLRIIGVIN